ncbi:hypothetical protein FQN49_006359, partial [Arthroderma sp. PD_2]
MERKDLSSNWRKLQQSLKPSSTSISKNSAAKKRTSTGGPAAYNDSVKRRKVSSSSKSLTTVEKSADKGQAFKRRKTMSTTTESNAEGTTITSSRQTASDKDLVNIGLSPGIEVGKYVAIDCEMVGVGPNPDKDSALARVSIVNYNGDQVYDSYVRPKEMVTDWRSPISGILPKHMVEARSLETVQRDVAKLLDDRILVGHAVRNDLDALLLSHSKRDIRDTSRHPPYRKFAGGGSPKLKVLASELLG